MRKYNNYAFIDSQNLNLSILDQGWKLDFMKFKKYLSDKYRVRKAFLFLGYVPSNKNLYRSLKSYGYSIIFKPTLFLSNNAVKGNVDAELVLHAVIKMSEYDKAMIVSGDGDFYCLIEYLKQQNKLLKLMIPNKYRYSSLFRKMRKDIVFMNELRGKLGYKTQNERH